RHQRHPANGHADPAPEGVAGIEVGPAVSIRAARGLAEAEADQQTDSADGEPRRPGESAGVAKDFRGKKEDASPDDSVDAEPDAVEQRHAVSGAHLPVTMPEGGRAAKRVDERRLRLTARASPV